MENTALQYKYHYDKRLKTKQVKIEWKFGKNENKQS